MVQKALQEESLSPKKVVVGVRLEEPMPEQQPVKTSVRLRVAPRSKAKTISVDNLVDPLRHQVSVSKLEVLPGVTVRLELPRDLCATLLTTESSSSRYSSCSMRCATSPPRSKPSTALPTPQSKLANKGVQNTAAIDCKLRPGQRIRPRRTPSLNANIAKQVGQKVAGTRRPETPMPSTVKWTSLTKSQSQRNCLKRKKASKSVPDDSVDDESKRQCVYTSAPLSPSSTGSTVLDTPKFVVWRNTRTEDNRQVAEELFIWEKPTLFRKATKTDVPPSDSSLPLDWKKPSKESVAKEGCSSPKQCTQINQQSGESKTDLSGPQKDSLFDALEKVRRAHSLLSKDANSKEQQADSYKLSFAEEKDKICKTQTPTTSSTELEQARRTISTSTEECTTAFVENIMHFLKSEELQSAVTRWMRISQESYNSMKKTETSTSLEFTAWSSHTTSRASGALPSRKNSNLQLFKTRLSGSRRLQTAGDCGCEGSTPTRLSATKQSNCIQTVRLSASQSGTSHTTVERERVSKFTAAGVLPDVLKTTRLKQTASLGRQETLWRSSLLARTSLTSKNPRTTLRVTRSTPESRVLPGMRTTARSRRICDNPTDRLLKQICFAAPSPWHELKAPQELCPEVPLRGSLLRPQSPKLKASSRNRSRSSPSLSPIRSNITNKVPSTMKTPLSSSQSRFDSAVPYAMSHLRPAPNKNNLKRESSVSPAPSKSSFFAPFCRRLPPKYVTPLRNSRISKMCDASATAADYPMVRMTKTALARQRKVRESIPEMACVREKLSERCRRGAEGVRVTAREAASHTLMPGHEDSVPFPEVPSCDRLPLNALLSGSYCPGNVTRDAGRWSRAFRDDIFQKKKKVQFCDANRPNQNLKQCIYSSTIKEKCPADVYQYDDDEEECPARNKSPCRSLRKVERSCYGKSKHDSPRHSSHQRAAQCPQYDRSHAHRHRRHRTPSCARPRTSSPSTPPCTRSHSPARTCAPSIPACERPRTPKCSRPRRPTCARPSTPSTCSPSGASTRESCRSVAASDCRCCCCQEAGDSYSLDARCGSSSESVNTNDCSYYSQPKSCKQSRAPQCVFSSPSMRTCSCQTTDTYPPVREQCPKSVQSSLTVRSSQCPCCCHKEKRNQSTCTNLPPPPCAASSSPTCTRSPSPCSSPTPALCACGCRIPHHRSPPCTRQPSPPCTRQPSPPCTQPPSPPCTQPPSPPCSRSQTPPCSRSPSPPCARPHKPACSRPSKSSCPRPRTPPCRSSRTPSCRPPHSPCRRPHTPPCPRSSTPPCQSTSPCPRPRTPSCPRSHTPPCQRSRTPPCSRPRTPPCPRPRTPSCRRPRTPPCSRPRTPPCPRPRTPPCRRPRTPPCRRPRTPPCFRPRTPPCSRPRTPPCSRPRTPPCPRPRTPPCRRPRTPPCRRPRTPPCERSSSRECTCGRTSRCPRSRTPPSPSKYSTACRRSLALRPPTPHRPRCARSRKRECPGNEPKSCYSSESVESTGCNCGCQIKCRETRVCKTLAQSESDVPYCQSEKDSSSQCSRVSLTTCPSSCSPSWESVSTCRPPPCAKTRRNECPPKRCPSRKKKSVCPPKETCDPPPCDPTPPCARPPCYVSVCPPPPCPPLPCPSPPCSPPGCPTPSYTPAPCLRPPPCVLSAKSCRPPPCPLVTPGCNKVLYALPTPQCSKHMSSHQNCSQNYWPSYMTTHTRMYQPYEYCMAWSAT